MPKCLSFLHKGCRIILIDHDLALDFLAHKIDSFYFVSMYQGCTRVYENKGCLRIITHPRMSKIFALKWLLLKRREDSLLL